MRGAAIISGMPHACTAHLAAAHRRCPSMCAVCHLLAPLVQVQHVLSRLQSPVLQLLLRSSSGGQQPGLGVHAVRQRMPPPVSTGLAPASAGLPGGPPPPLSLDAVGGGSSSLGMLAGGPPSVSGAMNALSMPSSSGPAGSRTSSGAAGAVDGAVAGGAWGAGGSVREDGPQGQGAQGWFEPQHPMLNTGAPSDFL